jgi:hypothetical protein
MAPTTLMLSAEAEIIGYDGVHSRLKFFEEKL